MNMTQQDAAYINCETNYIVGLETGSGNPSPMTAYGVFKGMQAAVNEVYGSDDLEGKRWQFKDWELSVNSWPSYCM